MTVGAVWFGTRSVPVVAARRSLVGVVKGGASNSVKAPRRTGMAGFIRSLRVVGGLS